MSGIGFTCANIVSAFDTKSIGTKVLDATSFWDIAAKAVASHDTFKDEFPGQHFIIRKDLWPILSGGVGLRTRNPDDYVLRDYRGKVSAYLARKYAEKLDKNSFTALIIYTREAYLADPDVIYDAQERERISSGVATHVLVAIIAGTNFMGYSTVVHNIAGGNNQYFAMSAEQLREKARWVEQANLKYSTVAD